MLHEYRDFCFEAGPSRTFTADLAISCLTSDHCSMITARSGKVAVSFPSAQVLLATMKYAIHMNCCFFRPPKSYWLSSKAHKPSGGDLLHINRRA